MDRLILLTSPKGEETATCDLDNLKTHTGQITLGVTGSTETSDEDLIVLINEGHATIPGYIGGDSLVVFLELDSHTLSDGGVGLLGLDCDLFDDDTSSVGGTGEWLLPLGDTISFFVTEIGPEVESPVDSEFATSINSRRLMFSHSSIDYS